RTCPIRSWARAWSTCLARSAERYRRACSSIRPLKSISSRASLRPSFTWAALSRPESNSETSCSTGAERNRCTYSRACSSVTGGACGPPSGTSPRGSLTSRNGNATRATVPEVGPVSAGRAGYPAVQVNPGGRGPSPGRLPWKPQSAVPRPGVSAPCQDMFRAVPDDPETSSCALKWCVTECPAGRVSSAVQPLIGAPAALTCTCSTYPSAHWLCTVTVAWHSASPGGGVVVGPAVGEAVGEGVGDAVGLAVGSGLG